MATTVMEHNNLDFAPANDRDTLYFLGGVALMVFGAGLTLSNPVVRKYLGQMGIGNLAQSALPDIERYMRLRNM
ncbi:MAG TPA: hypothetical protein VMG82_23215 [Candidatus Sulfotelmatobacter sp.]|nr:hypothetical protein [Candidatus Sulfotelmatobacter sp.]